MSDVAGGPRGRQRLEVRRDLEGRNFLVTGANSGIGRVTAHELARRGGKVWMACRSVTRARPVADAIAAETGSGIELLELDLADLASVRACAQAFNAGGQPLDVLVNNAGIAWRAGGLTRQGFELFFGVNHLGHFALTNLLLPALSAAACPRIVNVASMAHYEAPGIDWAALRRPTAHRLGRPEYCVSKLCNVLHARELARRAPHVRSYALHPGVVASGIWSGLPLLARWRIKLGWLIRGGMLSNEDGARTTVHCATAEETGNDSGLYYEDCRPKPPSPLAEDPVLARALWERSEQWSA